MKWYCKKILYIMTCYIVFARRWRFHWTQCWNIRFPSENCLGPIFSCENSSVHLSVRLSLHPSVMPFSQCSCYRIIMKFSGFFTIDESDVHAKGQRSKVKVTKVKTNFAPIFGICRNVTLVWIHRWLQNNAQSLKWPRRGALLFF